MMTMRLLTTLDRVLQSSTEKADPKDAKTWATLEAAETAVGVIDSFESAANVVLTSTGRGEGVATPTDASAFGRMCLVLSSRILEDGLAEFKSFVTASENGVSTTGTAAEVEKQVGTNISRLGPEFVKADLTAAMEQDVAFHMLRCAFALSADQNLIHARRLVVSLYRYFQEDSAKPLSDYTPPDDIRMPLHNATKATLDATKGNPDNVEVYMSEWALLDVDGSEWDTNTDRALCVMRLVCANTVQPGAPSDNVVAELRSGSVAGLIAAIGQAVPDAKSHISCRFHPLGSTQLYSGMSTFGLFQRSMKNGAQRFFEDPRGTFSKAVGEPVKRMFQESEKSREKKALKNEQARQKNAAYWTTDRRASSSGSGRY